MLSLCTFKPINWQNLLDEGENGPNAFLTDAKIHFSEKKYFGVRGTLDFHLTNKPRSDHIEQFKS